MKRLLTCIAVMMLCLAGTAFAVTCVPDEETYCGPYDNATTPYDNNLGALGTDSAAANIASESNDTNGTAEGELTLYYDGTGIKVYSGLNKVEVIPTGSDGWVGSYTIEMGLIKFQPTGRPELHCIAQTSAGWFGPCKVPEVVANAS